MATPIADAFSAAGPPADGGPAAVASGHQRPWVLVVAGPAGSGKTTVGRALAAIWPAVFLDQDTVTNPLMSRIGELAGAGDDLDHPAFRGPVRQARLDCLLDTAADNLALGWSAVLVAPFTAEVGDPAAFAAAFNRFEGVAEVRLLWVGVSPEVVRARRVARALPRDRAAALDGLPAPVPDPVVPFLVVDGAAEPAAESARVAAALRPS